MELVALRTGLTLRADSIALALRLESAGHALTVRDGVLLVSRGAALSAEDRALVTEHKRHLLAIAGYDAEVEAPSLDVAPYVGTATPVILPDARRGLETAAAPHSPRRPRAPKPKTGALFT